MLAEDELRDAVLLVLANKQVDCYIFLKNPKKDFPAIEVGANMAN